MKTRKTFDGWPMILLEMIRTLWPIVLWFFKR